MNAPTSPVISEQLSNRGLAPHIYESRQEAMNWNKK